jgi:hypothetical protein
MIAFPLPKQSHRFRARGRKVFQIPHRKKYHAKPIAASREAVE